MNTSFPSRTFAALAAGAVCGAALIGGASTSVAQEATAYLKSATDSISKQADDTGSVTANTADGEKPSNWIRYTIETAAEGSYLYSEWDTYVISDQLAPQVTATNIYPELGSNKADLIRGTHYDVYVNNVLWDGTTKTEPGATIKVVFIGKGLRLLTSESEVYTYIEALTGSGEK